MNLTDVHNLSDSQLRRAVRLRGSILPDGTRYRGQWELAGDLEDAERAKYDLGKSADFDEFYRGGLLKHRG
ncbi:MAG: hypothetical protein HC838_18020 [Spirulinaceae cyanobacterium RM2_2_10]|nr:hypothetical protein [Spirulinaceae cyanobacterium RM2_2_10]